MAKKSRIYGVFVRTASAGEFAYPKPVPGVSKQHVLAEINSPAMAALSAKYVGWYDIEIIGDISGEYYFQLTSKKNGNIYTFESHDYGWNHLNIQFQTEVNEMIEEIEIAQGHYDY
ncbi:hypothetical protein ACIPUO_03930 [Pectobacterium carotovorum]|uniref:hypothetical protein n=1 Tax=Pectobacterium carotovorum TaxID=554 RepID=UPI003819B85B